MNGLKRAARLLNEPVETGSVAKNGMVFAEGVTSRQVNGTACNWLGSTTQTIADMATRILAIRFLPKIQQL
jgi:hypothetical protein